MTHPQSLIFTPQSTAIVVFDIDGVVRDVAGSYRRAIADTVEHFTDGVYRPSGLEIDQLKSEGIWNNDWEASRELVYRYFEVQGQARSALGSSADSPNVATATHWRSQVPLDYQTLIAF